MRPSRLLAWALALLPLSAAAQEAWDPIYWNPEPLPGDVVLPLPCGGAMAFRRVDTTLDANWLSDAAVQLGNTDVSGQQHAESVIEEGLAGPLSKGDPSARFYLLGKYEVTADQMAAVMDSDCPVPDDDGSRPAEGVTWFDAQGFTARYTTWLYGDGDTLAQAAGPAAFVRLPTEAEWEFAARGGLAVPEADRRRALPRLDGPLEDHVWFSGFKSCDGATQPVGLLSPNPLGMHDMLGNVQELTADMFRLRRRDRSHGQVGGVVARGGSCLTQEARVRLSERAEVALFSPETGAPQGQAFTGFRLAIGAPILTSQSRVTQIVEGWDALADPRIQLDPTDDPIDALSIIAAAQDDEAVRDALLEAQAVFQTEMARRNEIELQSAKAIVLGGFLAARSYILAVDEVERFQTALDGANPNTPADVLGRVRATIARAQERVSITEQVLTTAIVESADNFPAPTFAAALSQTESELALRLGGMSARTRDSTAELLRLFGTFTDAYRAQSDVDPQTVYDALRDYRRQLQAQNP